MNKFRWFLHENGVIREVTEVEFIKVVEESR